MAEQGGGGGDADLFGVDPRMYQTQQQLQQPQQQRGAVVMRDLAFQEAYHENSAHQENTSAVSTTQNIGARHAVAAHFCQQVKRVPWNFSEVLQYFSPLSAIRPIRNGL
jgi:hypothetical protein